MITLKAVEKNYRTDVLERLALNNINLHIDKGEFLTIVGQPSSGKSTLLNIIGLLSMPSRGQVSILNEKTEDLSEKQLAQFRNKHFGFIFQDFHLINDLSVLENVKLPLIYRSLGSKEKTILAGDALEKIGICDFKKNTPKELSEEQRHLVVIARAIVGNPEIIVADISISRMQNSIDSQVMNILMDLNFSEGKTIITSAGSNASISEKHRLVRLFNGEQVL